MTVSTTLRKAGPFTGNGVTTTFPFAFKVFAASDVVATAATAGVETILALGVDYTVALNADQDGNPGGSITTTAPLANARVLVLTSAVPQTQNTLVTNNGGFFAAVFNAVFDRAVILIQQLTEVVSRSVTIPKTAVGVTSLQIAQVPNGVLTWAPDGSQIIAIPLPAAALVPALPNFGGNAGKFLTNDGVATASWSSTLAAFAGVGGATAAFPALKRNAAVLETRLGDDSAYASFRSLDHVFNFGTRVSDTADGKLLLSNNAGTAFTALLFGGVTNLFPSLKRNALNLEARLADDSALTGLLAANVREKLTANRTYFVAATGNDASDGLTAGTPFLTVQKAVDTAAALDLNGFTLVISVADGTYAGAFLVGGLLVGQKAAGQLVVQGNVATPANVVFSFNGSGALAAAVNGAQLTVKGVRFNSAGDNPFDLYADNAGLIEFQAVEFGVGQIHLYARGGGQVVATGNYKITGAADTHIRTEFGGRVRFTGGITVTLTGAPAFAVAFAFAPNFSVQELFSVTFTGGATGVRYSASGNAVINTSGGGATYLPGNSAGSTATGGQYI